MPPADPTAADTSCRTPTRVLAIVDDPESVHGRAMREAARLDGMEPVVAFIVPSLDLPFVLGSLTGAAAVAVPLGIRGATAQDRFTAGVADAIRALMHRGIPVFVAAGYSSSEHPRRGGDRRRCDRHCVEHVGGLRPGGRTRRRPSTVRAHRPLQVRHCTMANAIHASAPGETLASVASLYLALEGPDGAARDVDLRRVTEAIRTATPALPARLGNGDGLPVGSVLSVPTLRNVNRAVYAGHDVLLERLKARGFDHARKLLRHRPERVVEDMTPADGYSAGDVDALGC